MWNDELAQVAQNYAEQCVFENNTDRVTQQSTFSSVGENLAAGSGPADFTGFVQCWYDEVQDYNFSSNSCAANETCDHYTQVNHRANLTIMLSSSIHILIQGGVFACWFNSSRWYGLLQGVWGVVRIDAQSFKMLGPTLWSWSATTGQRKWLIQRRGGGGGDFQHFGKSILLFLAWL